MLKRTRKPIRSMRVERLEHRQVMATFGVPWPEPRSLSVSFPSGDASIGAFPNTIRQRFDQVTDRQQWQHEVLRAFQTWASVTNVNVGLVPDRGDDFGTVGLSSNDPRFGEIRIGAFPQGSTLANAAPFDPQSGTWSGDVLLNTDVNYFLADWSAPGSPPIPDANELGPAVELFSVLLHEAGNALGLPDTRTAGTVMNGTYSGPRGQLSSLDIAAIRRLYGGGRRDIYENISNNALTTATPINTPAGYQIRQPLSVSGSLNTRSDVDVYRFQPLRGQDKVSVRLWTSGISLLKARLEVLDRFGNVLASTKADSIFANNLQLDIGSLSDHPLLYVRVARNTNDVFAIGDYRLDIDYRDSSLQPSLVPPAHDADAVDDDDDPTVDFVSVDQLFASGLLDLESGRNDTLSSAVRLTTPAGYLPRSRYEVTSSISGTTDRDLWQFQTPDFSSPIMTVNVDTLGLQNPAVEVYILNSLGDRIGANTTRKADGGMTLVVNNPGSLRNYVLFIRTLASSSVSSGNYAVTIDFATDPANQLQDLFSAQVTRAQEHISRLDVRKTQLMRFDLSTLGSNPDAAVQITIYNATTGDIELTLAARSASSATQYVWLSKGSYYLRGTLRTRTGSPIAGPITFRLRVDVLSDDQGPRPSDPTQLPDPNVNNEFIWQPIDVPTVPPVINSTEPPIETPWNSDAYQRFVRDFYSTLIA